MQSIQLDILVLIFESGFQLGRLSWRGGLSVEESGASKTFGLLLKGLKSMNEDAFMIRWDCIRSRCNGRVRFWLRSTANIAIFMGVEKSLLSYLLEG